MIPAKGYAGCRVAVLGLGRSGRAAARSLEAGGAEAVGWDDDEETRERSAKDGIRIGDLTQESAWTGVVSLVVSPGIPHLYPDPHPLVRAAWERGVVVDNDIGLFFRSYSTPDWDRFDVMPRVVCVTGSNGKSTTTALLGHVLEAVGRPVQTGGNIGRGALDLDPASDGETVVLELSSYQIDLARALSPDIAVFLNFSPDHLDRHGGVGGYFAAKRRLFTEGAAERAIIGVDETEGAFLAAALRDEFLHGEPVIRISTARKLGGNGWSVTAHRGFLRERRRNRQVASIDLRGMPALRGVHNHQNACAAYAVCRSLGLSPRAVQRSMASFPGLPHRCQVVCERDGILYVNDSKATNADAAAMALASFENIRWIAGGRAKEGGIAQLEDRLDQVRKAYLIGESARYFADQLAGTERVISGTIDAAVSDAISDAKPGDVILLSPAAASFDQYSDFEERGEAFMRAVRVAPDSGGQGGSSA